jgi:YgiT-type zinc finger domain-containing protein
MNLARKCASCDNRKPMTRFTNEAFTIESSRKIATVKHLSGWRCERCGEVQFDANSARRYAAAGDALLKRHSRWSFATADLSAEKVRMIGASRMHRRHKHLDALLDRE